MSVLSNQRNRFCPRDTRVVAERPSVLNNIEAVVGDRWSHLGDGKMSKGA